MSVSIPADVGLLRDAIQSLLWFARHGHTDRHEREEIETAWQTVERLASGDGVFHRRLRLAAWRAYQYGMGRGGAPAKAIAVLRDAQDRLRAGIGATTAEPPPLTATPEGNGAPKRGRKSRYSAEKDAEVAEQWAKAKEHVSLKDFADEMKLSVKNLKRLLNRHAKRLTARARN